MNNIVKCNIYQDRLGMGTNYVIKYRILVNNSEIKFSCQIAVGWPVKNTNTDKAADADRMLGEAV